MNFTESKKAYLSQLSDLYNKEEILVLWYRLIEHLTGKKRIDVALAPNENLKMEAVDFLNQALKRLLINEPIQHILGYEWFYNNKFIVDQNVLIPRPETEELVHLIVRREADKDPLKIIDLCTGSGCIGISLSMALRHSETFGLDLSEKALDIAKQNNKANKSKVKWIQEDLLSCMDLSYKFDVIVSNPPYVRNKEKNEMKANVLEHEPKMALFVSDKDPLIFYKKIADLGLKNLKPKGRIYLEINQYLAEETADLFHQKGYSSIEIIKDFRGNNRIIYCVK